jgi:hypothetical protein
MLEVELGCVRQVREDMPHDPRVSCPGLQRPRERPPAGLAGDTHLDGVYALCGPGSLDVQLYHQLPRLQRGGPIKQYPW